MTLQFGRNGSIYKRGVELTCLKRHSLDSREFGTNKELFPRNARLAYRLSRGFFRT